MAQERKQFDRRWLWIGAAVVLVAVFFLVRSMTRDRLIVHTSQVVHAPLVSTIATNGRVEPETKYEIYSPLATTVKAVYVQPGDTVAAGKLLMVLDDVLARARVATAESGVKAAEAALEAATHNGSQQERQGAAADVARSRLELDEARRGLEALTKLNATGAASPNEVGAARARVATAEANLHASEESAHSRYSPAEVERVRSSLTEAEANLTAARQVLAKTSIHAPAAGTVYTVNAGATDFAEEGKLLLQLADPHKERVLAYFDEPEIGRLAVGQKVLIKWDARPSRVWHGLIERTPATVITVGTRNVGETPVKVEDVDGDLLPDTNVTVTVATSSEASALSVPREALHMENGKPYVYKVVKDGLQRTTVTTGAINLTQVAILDGLQDGDWVATGTTSGQPLQEGVPIKVVR
jgi:HlyD family secretion protein